MVELEGSCTLTSRGDKLWTLIPAQAIAGQFIQSFIEFPPSQEGPLPNRRQADTVHDCDQS